MNQPVVHLLAYLKLRVSTLSSTLFQGNLPTESVSVRRVSRLGLTRGSSSTSTPSRRWITSSCATIWAVSMQSRPPATTQSRRSETSRSNTTATRFTLFVRYKFEKRSQVLFLLHFTFYLCVTARKTDVIPSVRHHARAQILHSGARRVRHGRLEGAGGVHADAKRVRGVVVSPSATELCLLLQRRPLLFLLLRGLLLARPHAQAWITRLNQNFSLTNRFRCLSKRFTTVDVSTNS